LPNHTNDKLKHAQKLKDQFKYKEALEILSSIENVNELTVDEQFTYFLLQSSLFYRIGKFKKGLDTADWVFQKSTKTGNDLVMLDASLARGINLIGLRDIRASYASILKCEELISRIKDQPENIIGKRKADLAKMKCLYYSQIGEFDKSLEYSKTNLDLCEKYGTNRDIGEVFFNIGLIYSATGDFTKSLENYENSLKISKELRIKAWAYNNIGEIYRSQGDLDRSLEYYEHSLSLKKELGNKEWISVTLGNIGLIYYERGELDKGLNYLKKSLQLTKEINNMNRISTLFSIIQIYLDQNELESAQICLEELRKIRDIEENPIILKFTSYRSDINIYSKPIENFSMEAT